MNDGLGGKLAKDAKRHECGLVASSPISSRGTRYVYFRLYELEKLSHQVAELRTRLLRPSLGGFFTRTMPLSQPVLVENTSTSPTPHSEKADIVHDRDDRNLKSW